MFAKISGLFGVLKPLTRFSDWLIRLPFAVVFLFHGTTKFVNGIDVFAINLTELGITTAAFPIAIAVALAELLAGIGILVGTFMKNDMGDVATRLAGLAAAPVMIGAILMLHMGRWSFVPALPNHPIGGMEFQVVLLGLAIYFIIRGNEA